MKSYNAFLKECECSLKLRSLEEDNIEEGFGDFLMGLLGGGASRQLDKMNKAMDKARAQMQIAVDVTRRVEAGSLKLKNPEEIEVKKKKKKKLKNETNENLKNVSIPKGIDIDTIDLERAKFLCSLPKSLGLNPENNMEIFLNSGRFGPYLKCENKSARLENVEEIFNIGLNRAITLIAEAKPGRISSSLIKDLGEHPEDKKPVRIMKGQYGPYIKYKSLNATIPEEKDPTELTMEEALILIEKRREYDRNKKKKKK